MEFEDYDNLLIRFDGNDDKEMKLAFGSKSNWTLLLTGEKYYCGDTDYYQTKEITLKELYDSIKNIEKMYKNAKKDAKSELKNEFRRKNLKLINDHKKLKNDIEKMVIIITHLKEDNETLKNTIKLVK